MLNLYRNGAVGFIDWLDGSVIANGFAFPRAPYRLAKSMPSHGQISELQNRRIKLYGFAQPDNPPALDCATARADKLPTAIIRIVCDEEDRLCPVENFARNKDRTIARLIKR